MVHCTIYVEEDIIMYNENIEQWFKLNKNIGTPVSEMNKATTDMCKRIAEQNLELIEENIARFSNQVKRLSNVRSPEELINLQKDCLSENITAGMETTQKIIQMGMENVEEVSKLLGTTASKVSEKVVEKTRKYVKKAGKKAGK
jgi:hypothetical protein